MESTLVIREVTSTASDLLLLDRINLVPLYIHNRTKSGPVLIRENCKNIPTYHLQVVSEEGIPFTTKDLGRMSLTRNEVGEICSLCDRRRLLLASVFFPNDKPETVKLVHDMCFINPESNLQITFYLKQIPE